MLHITEGVSFYESPAVAMNDHLIMTESMTVLSNTLQKLTMLDTVYTVFLVTE